MLTDCIITPRNVREREKETKEENERERGERGDAKTCNLARRYNSALIYLQDYDRDRNRVTLSTHHGRSLEFPPRRPRKGDIYNKRLTTANLHARLVQPLAQRAAK